MVRLLSLITAALTGFLASPSCFAVLTETGLFVPYTNDSSGDPARLSYVEVQNHRVYALIVAFDRDSGEPQLYEASAPLRDDAQSPGGQHPPQIRTGYYPLHAASATLFLVKGGRCLTCSDNPVQWLREPVGEIQIYFPSANMAYVEVIIDPGIELPPGVLRFRSTSYHRIPFGRERVLNGSGGPGELIPFFHFDLRGQWVFVDQADAGEPLRDDVVRADFTERLFNPDPANSAPHIHYRDPQRGTELRCTSIGTVIGGKAAGCELHRGGRVLLSARREDLGMDRIQAMRGELPRIVALVPTVTDPYRHPGQVIGLRVSMPPSGPLVPDAPDRAEIPGPVDIASWHAERLARDDGSTAPAAAEPTRER